MLKAAGANNLMWYDLRKREVGDWHGYRGIILSYREGGRLS